MTNIHYVLDWKFGPESGVGKKVRAQVSQWRKFGLNCKLTVITSNENFTKWLDTEEINEVVPYQNAIQRAAIRNKIYKSIAKKSEFLYARFGFFTPKQIFFFSKLNYFLEVNTIDKYELVHRSILLKFYRKITDRVVLSGAKHTFCVTNEIKESLETDFDLQDISVITNSISLQKRNTNDNFENSLVKLIFVGSRGLPWHGLDRICKIAQEIPEYQFILVGVDQIENSPDNILFLDPIFGSELENILGSATVAISSLSLDVNLMREACPLKSREYLANGLPIITGYRDSAFSDDCPFILSFDFEKETDWTLNVCRIRNFVEFWKGKRVPMNQLSEIDIEIVEGKRLKMMQQIIDSVKS